MPVTRIKNNQITDLTVNAASKLQDFSITSTKIANNFTYGSNFTIAGNLTVQGNVTAIDTVDLVVEDPLILLAKDQSGVPSLDIGFIGKRGNEDNIAFVWDESTDRFVAVFTPSEVTNTVITINSYASLQVLDLDAANLTITGNTVLGNLSLSGNVAVDMGNSIISNVAEPVANSDVATKLYVDSQSAAGFTIEDDLGANTVVSGGDTLFLLGTTDEISVLVTGADTVTFGLPANVTIANNLIVTDTANVTNLNASSNVSAGNAVITNDVSANTGTFTGNVSGSTFLGNVDGATGAFTGNVSADTFLGNVDGATGTFSGNVSGATFLGNVDGATGTFTGNVSADTFLGNIDGATGTFTGNVSGATFLGNIDGATGAFTGNVSADTFLGNVDGATGTFTGNVSADTFLGNIDGATGIFTGNISANYFIGNGSLLTGISTSTNQIFNGNSNVDIATANANITMSVNGISNVVVVSQDQVAFSGNLLIVNDTSNTVLIGTSTPTTDAALKIGTTDSIMVPVGNTAQRPGTPATGMLRFNTTNDILEYYDSDSWESVSTEFTIIVADSFSGDGSTVAFTLTEDSTTAATIVSINGVVQEPTVAYAVAGNVLTFTEAPEATDTIDARILTTSSSVDEISNGSGNAIIKASESAAEIQITGDLVPTANLTYDLGSPTAYWQNAYFAGNTIFLGPLQLKAVSSSEFGVFTSDGTTTADLDVGNIDVSAIIQGNTVIGIASTNGNAYVTVDGTANVLVVSSTGADVTGDMSVTGNVTAQNVNSLSDAVLKTNIQPISGIENVLYGLKGVEYDWKNGSGHSYGFLAQEVEKVLPSAVKTGSNGLKSINYMMIIPFLVETIKDMGDEIKNLKTMVAKIKRKT